MRTLEMSKNLVADLVVVTNKNFNKMDDRQKFIGDKVLELAPTVLKYLSDIEQNKADALVKLTKLMDEFEGLVKPETLSWSAIRIVRNDLEMFFEENL